MRLTVGPLPPAVYWRRRAMVLGVVLLFVLVIVYSCSGPEQKQAANPEQTSSPQATTSVHTPTSDPPSAEPTVDPVVDESNGPEPSPAPAGKACADSEIQVTVAPSRSSMPRGGTVEIKLTIKNISDRTCDLDVGPDAQEVYLMAGAQRVWSSDTCGTAQGSNVVSFPPNIAHEYRVAWNGKESTACAGGAAAGQVAAADEYQIYGRLGTKHSDPVPLTVTG
ncbi:MAG TPA: hypothetical protein VF174_00125 [Micromonosporaceae bacterium]